MYDERDESSVHDHIKIRLIDLRFKPLVFCTLVDSLSHLRSQSGFKHKLANWWRAPSRKYSSLGQWYILDVGIGASRKVLKGF